MGEAMLGIIRYFTKTFLLAIISSILFANIDLVNSQALECCGAKLQDSLNSVVIDTGYQLTPGIYSSVVLKVCTAEPLQIQVWTRINDNQYSLKWRISIDISLNMTRLPSVTLETGPLNITAEDRLALYSPGNSYAKLPVPFSSDANFMLRMSNTSYDRIDIPFVINLQELAWRRSFRGYLKFCATSSNCPNLDAVPPTSLPSSYSQYITIPANCCNQSYSTCNSSADSLDRQKKIILALIVQINKMKQIIDAYLNGTKETGYCPDMSFSPGLGRINYCYRIFPAKSQMAQAAIQCSDINSRLVFIQDAREDAFLKDLIYRTVNRTATPLKFWTSAIYGRETEDWRWFNHQLDEFQAFGDYTNWANRTAPKAVGQQDVCATYTVDPTGNFYWEKAICTDEYSFMCKIKKLCL